jgi:hypothetical protein
MKAETILAVTQFVGMVLSFTLLLKARRLSVWLWSTQPSHRHSPTRNAVGQPSEIDQIFRA